MAIDYTHPRRQASRIDYTHPSRPRAPRTTEHGPVVLRAGQSIVLRARKA